VNKNEKWTANEMIDKHKWMKEEMPKPVIGGRREEQHSTGIELALSLAGVL